MKRIGSIELRAWLVVGLSNFGVACGSVESGMEPASQADGAEVAQVAAVAREALQTRLVERAYPYAIDDDTLVCADWELVSAAGEVVDTEREWYATKTMNRHLANVGSEAAVAHVDQAFRDALLAKGIREIVSCDDAREYVALGNARQKVLPVTDLAPPAGALPPYAPDEMGEQGDLVDKIINGTSFDHLSTVGITVGNRSTCTGNLISPTTLVTAAHCLPISSGFSTVRAWIQPAGSATRTCISHPTVNNDCPTGGAANAFVQRHPKFDNVTEGWDQAVVIISPGWRAPANTSARWTRFAANWGLPLVVGLNANPVRIAGYGLPAEVGVTGFGRRGNSTHTIDFMSQLGTYFEIERERESSSATCAGDSGSGPYNTSLTGNNLMLGILRGPTLQPLNNCAQDGMVYSVPDGPWISSLVSFFGGTCATETVAGTPVHRCW